MYMCVNWDCTYVHQVWFLSLNLFYSVLSPRTLDMMILKYFLTIERNRFTIIQDYRGRPCTQFTNKTIRKLNLKFSFSKLFYYSKSILKNHLSFFLSRFLSVSSIIITQLIKFYKKNYQSAQLFLILNLAL
jgi:hypothetical protein